jgi:tetratricopeptide (TPR) repeat protein
MRNKKDGPARKGGEGRVGPLGIAALAIACAALPARAQTAALESLRGAVASRWAFQQRFPLAQKSFAGRAAEGERASLIAQLRPLAAAPAAIPSGAREPVAPGTAPALVWTRLALGLAEDRLRPGSGDPDLAAAAQAAEGDLGLTYEASRILEEAGLRQRAHAWQMETHRAMLAQGYVRLPEFAKLETWRAQEAMSQGKFQSAQQDLDFARRLDPMSPWIPFQNLVLHARERSLFGWDLGYMWSSLAESARLLRYYDAQALCIVNLSRCLRFGLGLFGTIGLLTLLARHFTRVAHPWAERLPRAAEMRVRYLAIGLALLSLAIGGLGYALLGILGCMLLWKHCSRDERSVLRAVLLGIALVPLLAAWERSLCRHLDPGLGVGAYHQAWSRGYDRPLADRAAALRPRTPEDSLFRALALSIQFRKQGNYLRAGEWAREASRLDPQGEFSLLNEGDLSMAAFDYGKAASAFASARRRAPDRVETWFNSSQAELYANNSAEHKKFLDRAAEIDAAWVTQWLNDNDEHFPSAPPTRKAMDPMLRAGQIWMGAWRSLLDLDFLRVKVRSGILEIPGSMLLAAVALAVAALWFRFRRYSPQTHGRDLFECRICGRVMCRVCRKGVHCEHCFKTVSGVQENRVRVELVARLRHRSALAAVRAASALNALFPGLGQLYLGQGGGRFLWPLAVSLLFGALWALNHPVMEYPAFALGPLRWLPLAPLLLAYGAFNLGQLRAPSSLEDRISAQRAMEKEAAR